MTFFDSPHCQSRAHCNTCRDLAGGTYWRSSIMAHFADVLATDFDCPDGRPWGYNKPRPDGGALTRFRDVRRAILAAPDEGLCIHLKESLRVHEFMLRLHGRRLGNCWVRRQRKRIISQYEVVLRKTAALHAP